MTTVLLGNRDPQMTYVMENGMKVQRSAEHFNQSVTRATMWEGFDDDEFVKRSLSTDNDMMLKMIERLLPTDFQGYAVGVYEVNQLMSVHSGGTKPTWVSSDDEKFAAALADFFGCDVGEPTAVFTNAGRDAVFSQVFGPSQAAAFTNGALTANSGSGFAVTDTTLAGEIVTPSGGLIRGTMTEAHTSGTNTSTLTKTWTANSSDSLPVTVASIGILNASSSGTLGWEEILSSNATLSVIGDSLTVTYTNTLTGS